MIYLEKGNYALLKSTDTGYLFRMDEDSAFCLLKLYLLLIPLTYCLYVETAYISELTCISKTNQDNPIAL